MQNLFRKRTSADREPASLPIELRSHDGALLRSLPGETLDSLRYMITELVVNQGLPKRLALFAALQGEGVTHTSLGLAATIANDLGRSVAVIELNWWKPGLHRLINPSDPQNQPPVKGRRRAETAPPPTPPRLGIAELLTHKATLDEITITTNLPGLALLCAGTMPMVQRPMVARSGELQALITDLSARYDHLVIDLPAILSSSDAIALATLADAGVMVVRQGITPTSNVQAALDTVKHVAILGVVLNQTKIATPAWIRSLIPQE